MKKARKGFTLVELLIVVAILATLTAAMTMSVSGATAKAKASTIASNVNACISAARLYAVNNLENDLSTLTAEDVLHASLPTWRDFKLATGATTGISYEALTDDANKGVANWAIIVDFSKDPEKDTIVEELLKIKGYGNSYSSAETSDTGTAIIAKNTATSGTSNGKYMFKVTLSSGKIEAYSRS